MKELSYLSLFCLLAHILYASITDDALWPVAASAVVLGVAAQVARTGTKYFVYVIRSIWLAFPPCGFFLARIGQVDDTYLIAYAFSSFILFFLHVAHEGEFVKYDVTTARFFVTRCTTYAVLRAVAMLFVKHLDAPLCVALLTPLATAVLETVGMVYYGFENTYTFDAYSEDFLIYLSLKHAVFGVLPFLEHEFVS